MIDSDLQQSIQRIEQDILTVATFVDKTQPGWTRRPFTTWYFEAREWLMEQMRSLNMEVSIDSASNVIGVLKGKNPSLPPIMIGSHLDTVSGGGRFDGIIGVLGGLEVVRLLKEQGIELQHTLEIVDFTAEEPSEFGISTIGSRGMVGNLTKEMLARRDPNGCTLAEAIEKAGGNPEEIDKKARKKGEVALYLEMHIEQGPVLEETDHKLGIVTGIVGIHRYRITVEGKPNHAGTTPMNMRQDALTSSSELILKLEELCKKPYDEAVVGTVGKLFVLPNAANVIPGKVIFEFEVRSIETLLIEQIISELISFSNIVSNERNVNIAFDCLSKSEPIRVEPFIQKVIEESCQEVGPSIKLPSGAGHDANQLATIAPIGMIFVPSRDGRSHCPEEWTDFQDIALGVQALLRSVIEFDLSL
ncbi:MAG: Zn-dependent hydrolase [Bacilli bacterium]|uniref:Zn-dependent hydrolase n=1 Tax=Ureibacillus suwonensis TaxID=313007 RepID=A0ABW0RE70_9BACL|nr:Zn-dependent hydrolase [Bacilli bacterium]